jgi:membrane protein DedA with SNARE-associated domain/rhodanese-related sulfurtransferase
LSVSQAFWILVVNTLVHELGVPLPVLPTVLYLAARTMHSAADLLILLGAIVIGTVIGNSVWFVAGRRYGTRVLKRLCRFSLTADSCVSKAEMAFERWGSASLVIGRFIPGVSLIAPALAGAVRMSAGRYVVLTTAGVTLYGLVVLAAGHLLRDQIDAALAQLHRWGWHLLSAAVVIAVAYLAWRYWRRRMARAVDVPRVSIDEMRALIASGEQPLVLDVRGAMTQRLDPQPFPGVVALPLLAIEEDRHGLPRDRKIIVYCGCPNEASAAKAARLLTARGYAWVRPLRGGVDALNEASQRGPVVEKLSAA